MATCTGKQNNFKLRVQVLNPITTIGEEGNKIDKDVPN
jgi:hypothetical protein